MSKSIIDATPTWENTVSTLILLLKSGGKEAQQIAKEEITRMAKAADAYIASQKEEKISVNMV